MIRNRRAAFEWWREMQPLDGRPGDRAARSPACSSAASTTAASTHISARQASTTPGAVRSSSVYVAARNTAPSGSSAP